MKIRFFMLGALLAAAGWLSAQKQPLTYFLPDISYDPAIPTPEAYFGWQIGEWHLSHDQQLAYLRALDAASPRLTLTEYARTHEQRPLIYLAITSEANHRRLEELRQLHLAVSEPGGNAAALDAAPVVLYQGFTIHGNEPSGANAAVLVAYYLAAGRSPALEQLLSQTVILLDPCFNPDGMQRFSTWANMHKNANLTAQPADREYNEAWPGGRTNHYWFDLNRDWLPAQHPESQGRLKTFHLWRPNILTDHHEMGSNATFFFMPGEPNRVHPLTPPVNQELTGRIAEFHAAELNKIGSMYYTREGFDDYYVGKGSTYPDLHGCIGILFEQASSRGHLQQTENGPLSFAFTIRNQVTTALSTHQAAVALRKDLLAYQRSYYQEVAEKARRDSRQGFVVADDGDPARLAHFAEILGRHQIEYSTLTAPFAKGGYTYQPGKAFFVSLDQRQHNLIRAIFEPATTFTDSLFYDISTWTLPLAFNLPHTEVMRGERISAGARWSPAPAAAPDPSTYAYLLRWEHYYAPKAAYQLMQAGLRLKSSQTAFALEGQQYPVGTVLIPVQNQGNLTSGEVHQLVVQAANAAGVPIAAVSTGLTPEGSDLGSGRFEAMRLPRVALVVGEGVSGYDAGEAWHLLDQRYGLPVTKLEGSQVGRTDLSEYNALILVDGNYAAIGASGAAALKTWVAQGNVIIAQQRAAKWCADNGLATLSVRPNPSDYPANARIAYGELAEQSGSKGIAGAIFAAQSDLSHPLLFGYSRPQVPVFRRGTLFFEPAKNNYATPMIYAPQPLLSGYAHSHALKTIPGSAAAVVFGLRSGRIICLADNPSLRAFWFGGNRLLLNAIFLGHTIHGGTVEQVGG